MGVGGGAAAVVSDVAVVFPPVFPSDVLPSPVLSFDWAVLPVLVPVGATAAVFAVVAVGAGTSAVTVAAGVDAVDGGWVATADGVVAAVGGAVVADPAAAGP